MESKTWSPHVAIGNTRARFIEVTPSGGLVPASDGYWGRLKFVLRWRTELEQPLSDNKSLNISFGNKGLGIGWHAQKVLQIGVVSID